MAYVYISCQNTNNGLSYILPLANYKESVQLIFAWNWGYAQTVCDITNYPHFLHKYDTHISNNFEYEIGAKYQYIPVAQSDITQDKPKCIIRCNIIGNYILNHFHYIMIWKNDLIPYLLNNPSIPSNWIYLRPCRV